MKAISVLFLLVPVGFVWILLKERNSLVEQMHYHGSNAIETIHQTNSVGDRKDFDATPAVEEPSSPPSVAPRVQPRNSSNNNIMSIHYHKSGDNFNMDLMRIVAAESRLQGFLEVHSDNGAINMSPKRSHTRETMCPAPLKSHVLEKGNKYFLNICPDLFCAGEDLAHYLQQVGRIVHMVRDPVDMALSNYLYHSQKPTPEQWVHKISEVCQYDKDMFDFVLPRAGIDKAKEMDPIIDACKSLFYGNETHPGYPKETYYQRLQSLSKHDGLRLSTAHFLIAKSSGFTSGAGDLMRMSSNAVALREWERSSDNHGRRRMVRNVFMKDLKHNMRNTTFELVDFVLNGVVGDDKRRWNISNNVASAMERGYNEKVQKDSNHITTQALSGSQRQQFREELERDEVFGPVLAKLRSLMLGQ